ALHELERADGAPELAALMDVRDHNVHAGAHDAERTARQHHALIIEAAHQDLRAFAFLVQDVLRRNFAVLEHQLAGIRPAHAELVELLRAGETFHAAFDDE